MLLLRTALYPVIAIGSVAGLVALVGRGHPYWQVGPPVLLFVALVVIALERWLPHATAWQQSDGDLRTDIFHAAGNVMVSQASVVGFTLLHGTLGPGLGVWPKTWPFFAQFAVGLAIIDVGLYAVHRASHSVRWLWTLHAIHHSPRRVYWLNGQRRHLVHELLEGLPGLGALGVLGAPPSVVACALAAVTIHLMFQHGNISYRAGPLRFVFAVAELHRWHHQRLYADVQGNYAAVFSLWDRLFGSALPKKGEAPLDVGMDDEPDLPADYLGQLLWPFRRRDAGAGE